MHTVATEQQITTIELMKKQRKHNRERNQKNNKIIHERAKKQNNLNS